ncbi:Pycsar system effector family protein, partial [Pedobacter sp.]|uniref:Pycsar system effector family protein n=1 Tax=Pedobacter sp. TaxID=1411316 RepID=UPI003C54E4D3
MNIITETLPSPEKIESLARHFFKKNKNKRVLFHTWERTVENIRFGKELSLNFELNERDVFLLNSAICFAYCDFLFPESKSQEKHMDVINIFRTKLKIDEPTVVAISSLLSMEETATPMLIDDIFHDVMTHHLGSPLYLKEAKRLKEELVDTARFDGSKKEWWQDRLQELSQHHFRTKFAQQSFDQGKSTNLELVKGKVMKYTVSETAGNQRIAGPQRRPKRGIETMFRITSGNNQRLSDMADKKAHILITVNSIILSAIISLVLRKLEHNQYLVTPSLILLANCLATMILSILATRPKIPTGRFYEHELNEKSVNLIYFGNFYK